MPKLTVKPLALCLAAALMPPSLASASAPDPWTISANAAVASQYVSRGVRQSWGKPALQAGVDAVHASGWSAGAWTSTISDRFVEDGRAEVDLYGGYSGAAGPFGYSAQLFVYRYPGARISATGTRFNYAEAALGLSYQQASSTWSAKYYRTVSRDFFGIVDARGTGYLDLCYSHDLGAGTSAQLHLGDARVAGPGNAVWNWRDARLSVTRTFDGGWSLSGAASRARGATAIYDAYSTGVPDGAGRLHSSNPLKATLVLSAARTF